MEAGALSALIEDRPNMRGPVGDQNVFVTSSRIYSVLRAVVGDDAPTFPDMESRREFLSAALGGRVEFFGETALRAKFWPLRVGGTGDLAEDLQRLRGLEVKFNLVGRLKLRHCGGRGGCWVGS
uniref:Uncharacterized protein n=1 Tax=Chromera velia CCMP2878 TaxID=1169474 RepID=A0A0G4I6F7_9ALVE|eukprot:Cvel_11380.t1-p1 / transcript=Cvel_11380.t1 / gene=Cvel_11380 / organism=Chromera_velia_CCMP2878 / gene_product=hypothetical protein / transcript_product=hypothetical protein / location=Cvel_scaffold713:55324-57215(+) / protein_length=123 / sequence_SO=supercontig / SO=protein_coding / is_pseudo=false